MTVSAKLYDSLIISHSKLCHSVSLPFECDREFECGHNRYRDNGVHHNALCDFDHVLQNESETE